MVEICTKVNEIASCKQQGTLLYKSVESETKIVSCTKRGNLVHAMYHSTKEINSMLPVTYSTEK